VDWLLAGIEGSSVAQYLRHSRLPYAAVSGLHVLGISLLVGASLPLALRLSGFWRDIAADSLSRVLSPLAATGLVLAAVTGFLLFSVRAEEYAANPLFLPKMAFIAVGVASALSAHRAAVFTVAAARGRAMLHGALSISAWIGALACGRLLAFYGS
jgi:predicted membrane-bound spermidine synthase